MQFVDTTLQWITTENTWFLTHSGVSWFVRENVDWKFSATEYSHHNFSFNHPRPNLRGSFSHKRFLQFPPNLWWYLTWCVRLNIHCQTLEKWDSSKRCIFYHTFAISIDFFARLTARNPSISFSIFFQSLATTFEIFPITVGSIFGGHGLYFAHQCDISLPWCCRIFSILQKCFIESQKYSVIFSSDFIKYWVRAVCRNENMTLRIS